MVCSICKNVEAKIFEDLSSRPDSTFEIDCPQCGRFRTTGSADAELKNIADVDRWKISAWINEFKPGLISTAELEAACRSNAPALHHRAERMLRWISTKYTPGLEFSFSTLQHHKLTPIARRFQNQPIHPHQNIPTGASRLIPIGWCKSIKEMEYMIAEVLCNELKLLVSPNNFDYKVSPKGLLYLEGRRESVSALCGLTQVCGLFTTKRLAKPLKTLDMSLFEWMGKSTTTVSMTK